MAKGDADRDWVNRPLPVFVQILKCPFRNRQVKGWAHAFCTHFPPVIGLENYYLYIVYCGERPSFTVLVVRTRSVTFLSPFWAVAERVGFSSVDAVLSPSQIMLYIDWNTCALCTGQYCKFAPTGTAPRLLL